LLYGIPPAFETTSLEQENGRTCFGKAGLAAFDGRKPDYTALMNEWITGRIQCSFENKML